MTQLDRNQIASYSCKQEALRFAIHRSEQHTKSEVRVLETSTHAHRVGEQLGYSEYLYFFLLRKADIQTKVRLWFGFRI